MINVFTNVFHAGDKLKTVIVFYPETNERSAALMDKKGRVISFNAKHVYHPVGGRMACDSIVERGLVDESLYYGFECWQCYNNVYRLGNVIDQEWGVK